LAKLVRESACNKATPLVIVTGRDEQDTMHLSFSLGATYFLQKPIDTQKLALLLEKIQNLSSENRRLCARVLLNTDVTCTVAGKTLNGQTCNISQGGVQLEVVGLKLGDTLRMPFILPRPGTVVKAQGIGGVGTRRSTRTLLYRDECGMSGNGSGLYITRVELLPGGRL
jgi:DNA-binding response OmpR family regulator